VNESGLSLDIIIPKEKKSSFLDRMAAPKRTKVGYNETIAKIRKRNRSHKKKCKGKYQHDFSINSPSPRKGDVTGTESVTPADTGSKVNSKENSSSSDEDSSESSSCCDESENKEESQEKDFDIDFSE